MSALIKRHLLSYIRDKWAVFFSFLSVFIILALFLLFLGNVQEASVPESIAGTNEGNYLIYSWIFSGLIVVASATVPLGFLHVFIKDSETNAMDDFFVAPLSRVYIVLSYMLSAFLAGVLLSMISFIATLILLIVLTGYMLPLISIIQVIGLLLLSNLMFASIFFFITTTLKTSSAHDNLSTLVGTLIGFLAGLYVPIGSFSVMFQSVLNVFPPMQMASLMRQAYMDDALKKVFTNQASMDNYRLFFGVDIRIDTWMLSGVTLIIIAALWAATFAVLSVFRIKRYAHKK